MLQLTAPFENRFTLGAGSEMRFYDESGLTGSEPFVADPANGQSQRTVLVATPDAELGFSVQADLEMDDSDLIDDEDGAVCFFSNYFGSANVDCVAWGDALPAGPTAVGTPEAAIPAGNMIERSIAANCSTFFETGDDTNQSAADFAPVPVPTTPAPSPRGATPRPSPRRRAGRPHPRAAALRRR